jgi:hypothetical protein
MDKSYREIRISRTSALSLQGGKDMSRGFFVHSLWRWTFRVAVLLVLGGIVRPAHADPVVVQTTDYYYPDFADVDDANIIDGILREPMIPPGDHGTGRPEGPEFDPWVWVRVNHLPLWVNGVFVERFIVTFDMPPIPAATTVWFRLHPSVGADDGRDIGIDRYGRIDFPPGILGGPGSSHTEIYDLPIAGTTAGWFSVRTASALLNHIPNRGQQADWEPVPFSVTYPGPWVVVVPQTHP